jgi:hypothetical protein
MDPRSGGMTSWDRYAESQKQFAEDRRKIAPVVRERIARYADFLASWSHDESSTWSEFAEWVRALPDDDDRFKTLATFGTGIVCRSWRSILDDYFDIYVDCDSVAYSVVHWFDLASRTPTPSAHFDRMFDLLLLDAVGCALFDIQSEGA